MKKPYLLRTPAFDPVSGGIRVMYGLYGWLLAKGQIAYLNTQLDIPAIGIYPEIYQGNDMATEKIVRYVLQTPGVMGTTDETGFFQPGPTSFSPDDQVYVFSRVYDQWDVDEDHILFLPIIDLHTFKDQKKKRIKTAFYCARGANQYKHPPDAIEITRQFASDQQALADLLNECKTLYVYDKITAMLEVARLCGCPVEYWGETSLETLQQYEPGLNGLGFRKEEPLDSFAFREHYKRLIKTFEDRLEVFIDESQKN